MSAKAAKSTKTPAPAAAAAAAQPVDKKAAKEAKERAALGDTFVYVGKVVEGSKKLAPQAQGIVNLIQAAGKKGITRGDLVKGMEGVITTRQPLGRILSYYQKEIVDKGYVTHTAAAVPAATKAPKAAPVAKEEGEDEGEGEE